MADDRRRQPGEVGRLDRPPGERYREPAAPDAPPPTPDLARALLFGAVVATVLAIVWVLPATILDLSGGLIVLAALFGWLIGASVRVGAWHVHQGPHPPAPRLQAVAGALGAACWLGGTFLDYLVSLATLPASSLSLGERMANEPFLTWLGPQLDPLKVAELALLALVAWRSAR